ncbi:MAG: chromosome segregation protein SMC [Clostridiales bacterium]|nr:chromosome segregation protein SMC [Clostridiales bacterium]
MYLKRIELQGFKSFAGKTVLEFNRGITSVVGPNGSGKSNIADAVRWVLGEQSAKQLRGSKMFDVIFSGTQYRKSVGFAEVTLVVDNSNGKLPVDYTEVAVRRRLYRSGESEYSINNNTCRLKDIRDLFLDTGVGRNGYSIISQGKVQEILSQKSEDRRGIFEEAAGIMKYKVRKLEAQRKLERTEQNLLRIGDIVHELAIQLEPLKEQSAKAREFLELREVLQKNEVGLYLNNLKNYTARLEKYEIDIETLNGDIENQNEELEKAAADNEIRNIRLRELDELEQKSRINLNSFVMSVETTRHEIQISKERLNSITSNRKRAKREIAEMEEKKKQLSRDYYKREERMEYLEKQKIAFEHKLNIRREELDKILESLGEKEKEMEKLRDIIDDKSDLVSDAKIKLRTFELDNISIDENIAESYKTKQSIILEKDGQLLRMQDARSEADKLSAAVRKNTVELDDIKEHIRAGETKLAVLRDDVAKKRTRIGILENNHKILDDMEKRMEGYKSSVKTIIEEAGVQNSELKGILGITSRIIDVEPGYEKAVEASLGGNLQSILVQNDIALSGAIEFLKEQNKGRASFISSETGGWEKPDKDILKKAKACNGFLCMASEKTTSPNQYKDAIEAMLETTVIADTYENALNIIRKTGYTLDCASLEGDFFSRKGVVSGGSNVSGPSGIINREKKLRQLNDDIKQLNGVVEKLEADIELLSGEVTDNKAKSHQIESGNNEMNGILIQRRTEAEAAQSLLDRLTGRILSIDETMANQEARKNRNISETESIRKGLEELENEMMEIKARIAGFEVSHQEDRRIRDELHMDISDLKVSYNSIKESMESAEESLERIESERTEMEAKKELTIIEISEFNDKENLLKEKIADKEKLVIDPDIEKSRLTDILNSYTDERREIEEDANRHIDKVNSINRNILLLQNKCSKVEVSQAKTLSEIEAMKNRMWDEYGLTHNEALSKHDEIENIGEARNDINLCRKRLKELGNINVNSIEDYARTRERHGFLASQKEDLESSKEDLYKVIKEMNTIMKKTFKEQLDIINERFSKVFMELFEGGRAKIELVDETDILESGIDIIVQPPGKRLQNMMLLSGGEKAFTAIALIFAILEINPSPFCIFDEIEAALDETNVWKFGEYIQAYNAKTQFIMITHRKGTMEHSDSIYGVTMQEHGISKVVSMNMTD